MAEVQKEVIFKTSSAKIERSVSYNEDGTRAVEIREIHYPLKGYGNRYCYVIDVDEGTGEVDVYMVCNGWNAGCGSMAGSRQLNYFKDKEFVKEIIDEMLNVSTPADFHRIMKVIEQHEEELNSYEEDEE